MITYLSVFPNSVGAGVGNGVPAGLWIGANDLIGLESAELSDTGAILEGKLAYALLNSLYEAMMQTTPLGFPEPTKLQPFGVGINKFTEGVTFGILRMLDIRNGSVQLPPAPTFGSNLGVGKITFEDIWPASSLVASEGAVANPGVIIPNSVITSYGGTVPSTVSDDAREWVAALIVFLIHRIGIRTASTASAITRRTDPLAVRPTGLSVPQEYYDAGNPTAGITSSDLPFLRLIRETYSIEYEVLVNPDTQTFEVNIATT
ncbi:hypothetical protein [Synechocystis salina]|uniref:Uncharacterized protein n=1 Tax=Synechocystis salina LEGE 00031 TaxID=1828736 RepID=A0ABR9VMZ0_9SYNC|nr:hypothetical protein [Synechocystis salina]MBE9239676.1 hypothetical protein [Synechocystis salina LEGE 00041]MBE9252715.1 hypothetical protein [Synechocystis salina LEGE 00031]